MKNKYRWVTADQSTGLLIEETSTIVAWISPWWNEASNRWLGYQWNIIGGKDCFEAKSHDEAKAKILAALGLDPKACG